MGMGCIVDLRQMLEIQRRINLGGADGGVPKHFPLNGFTGKFTRFYPGRIEASMFVGRESELRKFRRFFEDGGMSMTLVYGGRRVGKSELIKQAVRESAVPAIYYF